MTTRAGHDPALCCSARIWGADVGQTLVDLAADPDWLKAQGVTIRQPRLSREPAKSAANDIICRIALECGDDDPPVFIADAEPKVSASCRGSPDQAPVAATGCCGGSANSLACSGASRDAAGTTHPTLTARAATEIARDRDKLATRHAVMSLRPEDAEGL